MYKFGFDKWFWLFVAVLGYVTLEAYKRIIKYTSDGTVKEVPRDWKVIRQRIKKVVLGIIACFTATSIVFTIQAGNGFETLYPNFLLFTPWGNKENLLPLWDKVVDWEHRANYDRTHIPILDARDYTYERMQEASDDWRRPIVVRGMFNNTPAVLNWHNPEYLEKRFGNFDTLVVQNAAYGTMQDIKRPAKFMDAVNEIFNAEFSNKYIFFPYITRKGAGNDLKPEDLQKIINIVLEDLETHRIFKDYGKHKGFITSQVIMGKGNNNLNSTTGSDWHCALGTNFFAQVAGVKRWTFLHPKYGKLLKPIRHSPIAFMTGTLDVHKWAHKIPIEYADLQAGDMLFNPPFYWHAVKNHGGLAIGCPLRNFWIPQSLRSNFQYFWAGCINMFFEKIGISNMGYEDYNSHKIIN